MKALSGFDYRPGFIDHSDALVWLRQLWNDLPWRQIPIHMFGRWVQQPRLVAWYADPGVSYTYSGLTLEANPWPQRLGALRNRLQEETSHRFNSVLVNAYRDGQDSMGWHADNEPELGPRPTIASVSLGEVRTLRVRSGRSGKSVPLKLESGSLLLMSGDSQQRYQHCIPKSARQMGLRINLTFRQIHSPP